MYCMEKWKNAIKKEPISKNMILLKYLKIFLYLLR